MGTCTHPRVYPARAQHVALWAKGEKKRTPRLCLRLENHFEVILFPLKDKQGNEQRSLATSMGHQALHGDGLCRFRFAAPSRGRAVRCPLCTEWDAHLLTLQLNADSKGLHEACPRLSMHTCNTCNTAASLHSSCTTPRAANPPRAALCHG